jgi:glutamate--cysteine ligase catalytic subunit
MLEAVPGKPYNGDDLNCLLEVEENMALRRRLIEEKIQNKSIPNTLVLSVSHFPLLGCASCVPSDTEITRDACNSIFTCDEAINQHPRFGTLTKNIRLRKGRNVEINVPLFMDVNTQPLTYDDLYTLDGNHAPGKLNHVYCDAMIFGMGQCCLQTTFQATDINDSFHLYDSLLPFTPIMMALTASTPLLRGYLTEHDVRWSVISQAVDDRKDSEISSSHPSHNKDYVLRKSRYASISSYLSPDAGPEMNDLELAMEEKYLAALGEAEVPEPLARHVAHLFTRDPLVVYRDKIDLDDTKCSDHFESIQSTNWQSLRFKPPPLGQEHNIGWRVEFRTMELQFTDFENAAYACFINLLIHVIRKESPNFYMPITKIDENMDTAHSVNSVLNKHFWFRKNIQSGSSPELAELTINEIMNGSENFSGILPMLSQFLEHKKGEMEENTFQKLNDYLAFIGLRASGALITNATWMRQFVRQHPAYKGDSIVNHEIVRDLFFEH